MDKHPMLHGELSTTPELCVPANVVGTGSAAESENSSAMDDRTNNTKRRGSDDRVARHEETRGVPDRASDAPAYDGRKDVQGSRPEDYRDRKRPFTNDDYRFMGPPGTRLHQEDVDGEGDPDGDENERPSNPRAMHDRPETPGPRRDERENERPDPEEYRPEEGSEQRIDEGVEEEIRQGNRVIEQVPPTPDDDEDQDDRDPRHHA